MTSDSHHKSSFLTRIRNYFLTGVIAVAPLFITAYLLWSFIQWVDSWVIPYVPTAYNPATYLPFYVPGIGLIIAILFLTLIGFLTANIIGRTVVGYGERLLSRMPVIRSIYNGSKQIFETVLTNNASSFKLVGLLEYPRKGVWALVFVATDTRGEVNAVLTHDGIDTLSVFLPTTPNPTSGFLLFVPRKDLRILDMSVEDGAKLVISAGLVSPEYRQKQLEKLAETARPLAPGEPLLHPSELAALGSADRQDGAALPVVGTSADDADALASATVDVQPVEPAPEPAGRKGRARTATSKPRQRRTRAE